MSTMKIKKGDTVQVMVGRHENKKEGKVISVDYKNKKVLVEGVNLVKKHSKPSAMNQNGGIIEKEAPIDLSNVMYLHKGKPTRIGMKVEEVQRKDGKVKKVKKRFAKSTGDMID